MDDALTGRNGAAVVDADVVPVPLRLYHTKVGPEWVDYNRHMSEWCYLLVMGENSDAFFRFIGIGDAYRDAGTSLFTVETHIRNLAEVTEGERLHLTLQLLGADDKRVHLAHEIIRADDTVVATGEQLLIHVDTRSGRAAPMAEPLSRRVRRIVDAHRALPTPEWVGQVMRIPQASPASTATNSPPEPRGGTG
ncbi:MAG: thioesterase family protein [Micrococcales bacterium]|nr:thioesterase family protein [Micrococcales bacterium]